MLEKFLENSGYIERKKYDFIRTKICARKRPNFFPAVTLRITVK